MNDHHAENMQRLTEAVLTSPGDTDAGLRQAIEAKSAELGGRPGARVSELPAELVSYVNKVALHAYKITDRDIEALRKAGYSEDAIFEITLSAALGAGRVRLQRGLSALNEANNVSWFGQMVTTF